MDNHKKMRKSNSEDHDKHDSCCYVIDPSGGFIDSCGCYMDHSCWTVDGSHC